jgi:two-component system OmpR family sensor kinase
VVDDGKGIDPVDLPFVFDRFYRGQGARGTPGAGLGLAICRALVEAQGGSIDAADAPGGGAAFTVLLPSAD